MSTLLANRYRLTDRVGSGGMGEVWRGTDEVLGRTVAVKLMRPELVQEAGFAARFLAEARTMATIKHRGVVAVYDYHSGSDGAFLVMEYVDGESLSGRLRRAGRLDPTYAMLLLSQAADALQAAHDRGVIHRDVKPANLLVTADDTVVLTDFGIARSAATAPVTATGVVIGTPAYLAPEQVLGQPATPGTDVYALGVVAYECLTGSRPFQGENPFDVAMRRIREPPPTLVGQLAPAVLAVVERALAVDPAQRWPSARAMAEAARRALAPQPATVPAAADPPTPTRRREPTASRPPAVFAANLLVRLAALSLGVSCAMLVVTVPDAVRVSTEVLGAGWATTVRLLSVAAWTALVGYGVLTLLFLLLAWRNGRGSRAARGWTVALGAITLLGLAPLGIASGVPPRRHRAHDPVPAGTARHRAGRLRPGHGRRWVGHDGDPARRVDTAVIAVRRPVLRRPPSLTDQRGEPELGQVALGNPSTVVLVDEPGDAVQQAALRRRRHGPVVGVGEQQVEVLDGRVRRLPFVPLEARRSK
jgi:tRNA A-37 threonylcarbamoyl transferase component Bud32